MQKTPYPKEKALRRRQLLILFLRWFCLGMRIPLYRKINVPLKITQKKSPKKVKPKKGCVVYILIFSSKCNLVLFADIGYRLYV